MSTDRKHIPEVPVKRFGKGTGLATKPMSPFIKALKGIKDKVEEAVGKREPRAPWFSYRTSAPSARQIRRAQKRKINATTKHYYRRQAQAVRETAQHNERMSVKVLTEYEKHLGLPPGGLRDELIAEGKLAATRKRIIDWDVQSVVTTRNNGKHAVPALVDVRVPVYAEVPIGHTHTEILEAAGLTAAKIQELNEEFAKLEAEEAAA